MKNSLKIIGAVLVVAALGACSTAQKEKIGLVKKAPNEFMVAPRAPLSVPPEYDLRPVVTEQPDFEAPKDEDMSKAEAKLTDKVGSSNTHAEEINSQLDNELEQIKANE